MSLPKLSKDLLLILLAVVLIVGIVFILFSKNNSKNLNTGKTPIHAPQGSLVPAFPKDLVPTQAKVTDSYYVAYSPKVTQNTTTLKTTGTITDAYNFYLSYLNKNGYLITSKSLTATQANIYGASAPSDVNVVMIKQDTGILISITYLTKARQ